MKKIVQVLRYVNFILILNLNFLLLPLAREFKEAIVKLVESNPRQLSENEYLLIAQAVSKRSPCNFLVFGVGRDSQLWCSVNKGRTVFIEHSSKWLDFAKKENPNIEAYLVKYNTKVSQWEELLNKPEKLILELPKEILDTKWDVIFVDAPQGHNSEAPGRLKSIFTASNLAANNKKQVDIFVHDCDRPVEKAYCDKYLSRYQLVVQVRKLRYYCKWAN